LAFAIRAFSRPRKTPSKWRAARFNFYKLSSPSNKTMSLEQSPLFEPVLWDGNGFKILDELLVPEKIEYIQISEIEQALDAVREMKTRAFGQVLTFLYSGALVAERDGKGDADELRGRLARMTEQFCDARPTFDFRGLGNFFEEWFTSLPRGTAVGQSIAKQAREFGQEIVRARHARAKRAAALLPDRARLLTHCNVSGELVAIAGYCRELGKELSVIATETRPYLQGTRLTAWELAQAGVPVAIIPDCAAAQVMQNGEVNAVIVGADRSAQNGDVINKVGTYPLALLAREYGVPFYALVQAPGSVKRGADVPIEERPAAELLMFQGESIVPGGDPSLSARYPAFDVTPARLITHLIGFDDLYTPETFRQKYQTAEIAECEKPPTDGKYLLVYGVPPKSQDSFLISALKAEQVESILIPEMRPQLWGAQVIAPRLLERRAPVTLISDNIMGTLFSRGEIRKLCLFYDSLTPEGPSGLCGSLLAVQLARLHAVPIELFQSDKPTVSPLDQDVSTFMGKKVCPAAVAVRPMEMEIIPWALFKS
jgi:methylthioribose-1-phosphate isomerase